MGRIYRESHYLSCIEINDRSHVHEPSLEGYVREVSCPYMTFERWVCGHEEVWVDHLDIRGLLPPKTTSPIRFDTEDAHDSLHSFSIESQVECDTS